MFVWKIFQTDIYIIFIFQTIFQYIELKDTYDSDDDLLHTAFVLLENLNCSFLGDLIDSFHELLSLHGIQQTDSREMFRSKCGNSLIGKFLTWGADGISDGENARIKDTDNISGKRLIHHMSVACHHLLRLGKTHFFITLYMINFHTGIKPSGTNSHECDPVSVCLVHIRLDLEDKG